MVPSRIIDWIDALKQAQGPILNKCFMGYSLTIKFEWSLHRVGAFVCFQGVFIKLYQDKETASVFLYWLFSATSNSILMRVWLLASWKRTLGYFQKQSERGFSQLSEISSGLSTHLCNLDKMLSEFWNLFCAWSFMVYGALGFSLHGNSKTHKNWSKLLKFLLVLIQCLKWLAVR